MHVIHHARGQQFTGGIITTLVTPAELAFIKAVGEELQITMQEGQQPGTTLPPGGLLRCAVLQCVCVLKEGMQFTMQEGHRGMRENS